jgi:hypothetical protein
VNDIIDKAFRLDNRILPYQADAEEVRDQALALLDDPRLKSAVSDAKEKSKSAPPQR